MYLRKGKHGNVCTSTKRWLLVEKKMKTLSGAPVPMVPEAGKEGGWQFERIDL